MFKRLLLICSTAALAAACTTEPVAQRPAETETGVVVTDQRTDRDYDRYPAEDNRGERTYASDKQIHDKIHRALQQEGMGHVTVKVENGEVWLNGHVRSMAEKQRAHDVAHAIGGVGAVHHDSLEVS